MLMKFRYIRYRKCDIFGVGYMVNGALSAGASLASSIYAADKQYEATKETNEANKKIADEKNALEYQTFTEANEFNRIEAEKQRAHALELQERSERYNSLENQVKQARLAGISPAAVAGGTQTSVGIGSPGAAAQSAPLPNYEAAHMQVPDLSALQGISSAFQQFTQGFSNLAQSRKANEETKGQQTLNKWIDKEKAAGVYKSRSEASRNFAEAKLAQARVDETNEKVAEIKANVAQMTEETFSKQIENAFKSKQMEYLTKKMKDEYKITHLQAKKLAATLAYEIAGVKIKNGLMLSQIGLNAGQLHMFEALTTLYGTQNNQAVFDLGIDEETKEIIKGVGIAGDLFKILSYFIKK